MNTGFGKLSDRSIGPQDLGRLQGNLVLSHCVGAGPPLTPGETRLVLALKIATLAQGYSGVRPALMELMLALLNRDVLPVIPNQGNSIIPSKSTGQSMTCRTAERTKASR